MTTSWSTPLSNLLCSLFILWLLQSAGSSVETLLFQVFLGRNARWPLGMRKSKKAKISFWKQKVARPSCCCLVLAVDFDNESVMRLFSSFGRPLQMGVASSPLRSFSALPRFVYSNAETPKWESGEVKVYVRDWQERFFLFYFSLTLSSLVPDSSPNFGCMHASSV